MAKTVGIAYAQWLSNLPSVASMVFASFRNGDNDTQIAITINTVGQVEVRAGTASSGNQDTGDVLAISEQVIVANAWQHIEAKVTCDSEDGAVEVRVNDVPVLTVGGLDLNPVSGLISQVLFSSPSGVTPSYDDLIMWVDDGIGICDFVGQLRCTALYANADTLVADWQLSEGSQGYPLIAKTAPNDNSYIFGQGQGDVSEFEMTNVPPNIANIAAIVTHTRSNKKDEGTANLQVAMVSGSEAAEGVNRPLTTEPTYYTDVYELDPNTGAPWTKNGIDNALIRFVKTQ